jgi:GNAT superfamily N-acetyltransferase
VRRLPTRCPSISTFTVRGTFLITSNSYLEITPNRFDFCIIREAFKMPAMLDDPSAPTIYRTSGAAPFPDPHDPNPAVPLDVFPRQVTLRDRVTTATIVPFTSRHQVPTSLLAYLADQFNKEIDMGDTYPMMDTMTHEKFASYWFQNFGAIMLIGNIESASEVVEGRNWATECLGSYYIKPNYPGRSSHVCNAGFLVTDAARGKGAGRLMGESYLEWAPRLGYTYSVFNLGEHAFVYLPLQSQFLLSFLLRRQRWLLRRDTVKGDY